MLRYCLYYNNIIMYFHPWKGEVCGILGSIALLYPARCSLYCGHKHKTVTTWLSFISPKWGDCEQFCCIHNIILFIFVHVIIGVQWPYFTPGLGEYFIMIQIPSVGLWGRSSNCTYSRSWIIILRHMKDQEQISQTLFALSRLIRVRVGNYTWHACMLKMDIIISCNVPAAVTIM